MSSGLQITELEFSPYLALIYTGVIATAVVAASAAIVRLSNGARSLLLPPIQRTGSLDGLRGILALAVMIHHSFTAYGYFMRGQWIWSSSSIFNQLGQSSVAMFFMITGFLFSQRLLQAVDGRAVRWRSLYLSRFARLVPLYAVMVTSVLISVFALSDWTPRESMPALGRELLAWYLFVIPGQPDINLVPDTALLIAGVNWSLAYEWEFYFFLPMLYFPLRIFAGPKGTRLAIAGFALLLLLGAMRGREIAGMRLYLLHFGSGILAALIYRDAGFRSLISSRIFRVLALVAVLLLASLQNSHSTLAVALAFVFLLAVLGDLSIAGLLKWPAIIWLGEISYGVYLTHGFIIFWTWHLLSGAGVLAQMGLLVYTAMVAAAAILVTGVASISYIHIEKPSIDWGKRVAAARLPAMRALLTPP